MRKFYLLFAALFAWTMVATAGIKNLYKQDFEAVNTPQDAGWSSPNLAGGMSLVSSEYGKWFEFSLGSNNNRNAVLNWNPAEGTIFDGQDVKEYTIKFQWGLNKNPSGSPAKNVQFSSEIAVLSPHNYVPTDEEKEAGVKATNSINNGQYATADSLRLFSITQLKGAYSADNQYWADENDLSNYAFDFFINGDQNNVVTLTEGMWYDITLTVNVEARTIKYEIAELGGVVVNAGTGTIADNCDPYAKGINVLLGRYYSVADIDEVKVQVATEGDYANAPTISMTEINMQKRSYEIYFEEGEILHVKTTEGTEETATESPFKYSTETSGTLEAWTESGNAISEKVSVEVKAEVITLPQAKVDITKVNEGYVKSLKMTVDNSNVETQPNITLTWEYSNGDKSTGEVASGAVYEAKEKGTLTVTTHAYGFGEATMTFENDTEFAVDQTIDLQHVGEAALTEMGFAELDPLGDECKMSGEGNWIARERLWYGIATGEQNADGTPAYEKHVAYGYSANGGEVIRRFQLAPSKVKKDMFAPLYTWASEAGDGSDAVAMKFNLGIGMIQTGILGEAQDAKITVQNITMGLDGLTDNDYYIVYVINNYGGSSLHPLFEAGTAVADATAAYKAMNLGDGLDARNLTPTDTDVRIIRGTETFDLYRIDTALARIDIFKAKNASGIETLPYNQIVSDHNAPIYNLNGVQVNPNALTKGIYIKQGHKFVVK